MFEIKKFLILKIYSSDKGRDGSLVVPRIVPPEKFCYDEISSGDADCFRRSGKQRGRRMRHGGIHKNAVGFGNRYHSDDCTGFQDKDRARLYRDSNQVVTFLGAPIVALGIGTLLAIYGLMGKADTKKVLKIMDDAIKDTGIIMLLRARAALRVTSSACRKSTTRSANWFFLGPFRRSLSRSSSPP